MFFRSSSLPGTRILRDKRQREAENGDLEEKMKKGGMKIRKELVEEMESNVIKGLQIKQKRKKG